MCYQLSHLAIPSVSYASAPSQPVVVFWKGMNLATTPGMWHLFYGQKGLSPMFARSPVGFSMGDFAPVSLQQFDGRFQGAAGGYWSLAILKCLDALVVFENPNADRVVPFEVLRACAG